jgi:hypothetical protein
MIIKKLGLKLRPSRTAFARLGILPARERLINNGTRSQICSVLAKDYLNGRFACSAIINCFK